jgi:hypothetical protein
MFQDPIIKEIRKIRHEIEAECQNNSQKYYEYIQEIQAKYRDRLVRRGPKPAMKKNKSA